MRCDDLAGFGKDTQSLETCGPLSVFCYKLHLAGALRLLLRWKIVLNLICGGCICSTALNES